jgi:hypothetical protein
MCSWSRSTKNLVFSGFPVREGRPRFRGVVAFSRFGRRRAATEVFVFIQSCCIFIKIRHLTSRGLCGLV